MDNLDSELEDMQTCDWSEKRCSVLSQISQMSVADENVVKTGDEFSSIPYGFQLKASYEHKLRNSDIMGVTYNCRMKQFVIIDSKCVTFWKRGDNNGTVHTGLVYDKYEYRVINKIIYAKKYNCYFALGKQFSLKVYNKDFEETCSVSSDMRLILFMLFNETTDELITGGVAGMKIWKFHQASDRMLQEIKPLANYRLTLTTELTNVGGSWVKKVELEPTLQQLYCCSETDLYAYSLNGSLLFKFIDAHSMSITGCKYSHGARLLVTCSIDTEVKVWSMLGGLVHTFRGHSKPVTDLAIHPQNSCLIITSSMDGNLKLWSLDTMDLLYTMAVSPEGIEWMGLTDDKFLYVSTRRSVTMWSLNTFYEYWGLARTKLSALTLTSSVHKSTRVVSLGADNSVRLFSCKSGKNLSTVLPPPNLSPMETIVGMTSSREFNVVYLLLKAHEVWVYTTRTDPACRVAVWNLTNMQKSYARHKKSAHILNIDSVNDREGSSSSHRCTKNGQGSEVLSDCTCITFLDSNAIMWTDEGNCSPLRHSFLLLGLEDGRVLFMDPVTPGYKHMEFKVARDSILNMRHDTENNEFVTVAKYKERLSIQTWTLPYLTLTSKVFSAPDMTCFCRLGGVLFTGHLDGYIDRHILSTYSTLDRDSPSNDSLRHADRQPEHTDAIIALDSCPTTGIIVSCSAEGSIKVWDSSKVLLKEIMLDNSVSCACFLNSRSDLLIGFLSHIFIISGDKVYSRSQVDESLDSDCGCSDSDVYEDPSVRYEGVAEHRRSVTLQTYLVPYNVKLSEEFLKNKQGRNLPSKDNSHDESEESQSEMSQAPTDMYRSPTESPREPHMIDLMVRSKVASGDLDDQMPLTEQILIDKVNKKRSNPCDDEDEKRHPSYHIYLPRFGQSPGPSPSPSVTSRALSPSSLGASSRVESRCGSDIDGVDSDDDAEDRQTSTDQRPRSGVDASSVTFTSTGRASGCKKTRLKIDPDDGSQICKNGDDCLWRRQESKILVSRSTRENKSSAIAERPPRQKISTVNIDVENLIKYKPVARETRRVIKSANRPYVLDLAAQMIAQSKADLSPPKQKIKRQITKKQPVARGNRKFPPRGLHSADSQRSKVDIKQNIHVSSSEVATQNSVSLVENTINRTDTTVPQNEPLLTSKSDVNLSHSSSPSAFSQSYTDSEFHLSRAASAVSRNFVETPENFLRDVENCASADGAFSKGTNSDSGISAMDSKSVASVRMFEKSSILDAIVNETPGLKPERDKLRVSHSSSLTHFTSLGESANEMEAQYQNARLPLVTVKPSSNQDSGSRIELNAESSISTATSSFTIDNLTTRITSIETGDATEKPQSSQNWVRATSKRFNARTKCGSAVDSRGPTPFDEDRQSVYWDEKWEAESTRCGVNQRRIEVTMPRTEKSDQIVSFQSDTNTELEEQQSCSKVISPVVNNRLVERLQLVDLEEPISRQRSFERKESRHPNNFCRPFTANNAANTTNDVYLKRRPHTAYSQTSFHDLNNEYHKILKRYSSLSCPDDKDIHLYQNSGTKFESNWQERMAERHWLLRTQKELRSQSAAERRERIEKGRGGRACQRPSTAGVVPPNVSPALGHEGDHVINFEPIKRPHTVNVSKPRVDKRIWAAETPFRCTKAQTDTDSVDGKNETVYVDVDWLEPRNKTAVRPRATSSIPSKCSRYFLVTKKGEATTSAIPATPLEQHLLQERFSQYTVTQNCSLHHRVMTM